MAPQQTAASKIMTQLKICAFVCMNPVSATIHYGLYVWESQHGEGESSVSGPPLQNYSCCCNVIKSQLHDSVEGV